MDGVAGSDALRAHLRAYRALGTSPGAGNSRTANPWNRVLEAAALRREGGLLDPACVAGDVLSLVTAEMSLFQLLSLGVSAATELCRPGGAFVFLVDPATNAVVTHVSTAPVGIVSPSSRSREDTLRPHAEFVRFEGAARGAVGVAVDSGSPVVREAGDGDPETAALAQQLGITLAFFVCVPIAVGDGVTGALFVANRAEAAAVSTPFDAWEVAMVASLASVLGVGLAERRLEVSGTFGTSAAQPLFDITDAFQAQLCGVNNVRVSGGGLPGTVRRTDAVFVTVRLYHGHKLLCPPVVIDHAPVVAVDGASRAGADTPAGGRRGSALWMQWARMPLAYRHLPLGARLVFEVCTASGTLVGWAALGLFDGHHVLAAGQHRLRLWPGGEPRPLGSATPSPPVPVVGDDAAPTPVLVVSLRRFPLSVVALGTDGSTVSPPLPSPLPPSTPTAARVAHLRRPASMRVATSSPSTRRLVPARSWSRVGVSGGPHSGSTLHDGGGEEEEESPLPFGDIEVGPATPPTALSPPPSLDAFATTPREASSESTNPLHAVPAAVDKLRADLEASPTPSDASSAHLSVFWSDAGSRRSSTASTALPVDVEDVSRRHSDPTHAGLPSPPQATPPPAARLSAGSRRPPPSPTLPTALATRPRAVSSGARAVTTVNPLLAAARRGGGVTPPRTPAPSAPTSAPSRTRSAASSPEMRAAVAAGDAATLSSGSPLQLGRPALHPQVPLQLRPPQRRRSAPNVGVDPVVVTNPAFMGRPRPPSASTSHIVPEGGAGAGSARLPTVSLTSHPRPPEPAPVGAGATLSASAYAQVAARVAIIVGRDPLAALTPPERRLLFASRYHLVTMSKALPKFLLSVDWGNAEAVSEVYKLLPQWRRPTPGTALQLLGVKFPDPVVRAYAVTCLDDLEDGFLQGYMLQLVQALRLEASADTALARFLLRRALGSEAAVGHVFFWYTTAEKHHPVVAHRFQVLLDVYTEHCAPGHAAGLTQQAALLDRLHLVAMDINARLPRSTPIADVTADARRQLADLAPLLPPALTLPLAPDMRVTGLTASRCRVMKSKKRPLWLEFTVAPTAGGAPVAPAPGGGGGGGVHATTVVTSPLALAAIHKAVLFKAGDDLRQDQLTLQVLRVMDGLWKAAGLDLCMQPYSCVATGPDVGLLEVVRPAETIAGIIRQSVTAASPDASGFKRTATAAFWAYRRTDILRAWLEAQACNQVAGGMEAAERNFARSAAGYCVATYVLGIGDRHNDNIMLTPDGRLFHIDFGHFLGNFKKKAGFKRERAPFVFTKSFAEILGSVDDPRFAVFLELACKAFLVLRRHTALLVTLFSLMTTCGIPELHSDDDIRWLRAKLMIGATDAQAEAKFLSEVDAAMASWATRFNDACHIIANG